MLSFALKASSVCDVTCEKVLETGVLTDVVW